MNRFLSDDGNAEFTYYPSDRVEIRLSEFKFSSTNFCVTVYKPGRCRVNRSVAHSSPVITFGQNTTTKWSFYKLQMLMNYISEAIKILNKEGSNLIDPNFELSYSTQMYSPVKQTTKAIPTREVVRNAVYEQENGRRYIFITKGTYRELGDPRRPLNRDGCDYVYLEVTDGTYAVRDGKLIFNRSCILDSVSNPRKFIKVVATLQNWYRLIGGDYNSSVEYKF